MHLAYELRVWKTKTTYSSEFWADDNLRRFVECGKQLDLTCEARLRRDQISTEY